MFKKPIINENALQQCTPINLAYIGDAVFELRVRQHFLALGRKKIKEIHKETVALVNAGKQAEIIREIFAELSLEEKEIVKKGRNAKSSPPKNTPLLDYLMSTGFEALLGYLYLKGDEERLEYLLEKVLPS